MRLDARAALPPPPHSRSTPSADFQNGRKPAISAPEPPRCSACARARGAAWRGGAARRGAARRDRRRACVSQNGMMVERDESPPPRARSGDEKRAVLSDRSILPENTTSEKSF